MPVANDVQDIPPVLAVDLDGSLIQTDMLWESLTRLIATRPMKVFLLPLFALNGRASLKAKLAELAMPDAGSIPYREDLLEWLRSEKALGRRIVLATASDQRMAQAVADHVGIFDEIIASDGKVNLKGELKRQALVSRFGERGFDYVGNDSSDLKVWPSARQAIVVSATSKLETQAAAVSIVGKVFRDAGPRKLALWARALRLHQWLKNLLVLVPLLAAHRLNEPGLLLSAVTAFFAFGLCASSVYLLNDLIDAQEDRHHRSKRHRPFASGRLPMSQGWLAVPIPLLMAAVLAISALPPAFAQTLAVYYALTLMYSLKLKRVLMLDVLALAGLYTLRIIAGAFAIGVPLSFWLLSFSMFIFMSLALIKRYTELLDARRRGVTTMRGRGYHPGDLEMVASLGAAAGYLAVLVLALYIQDPTSLKLYRSPHWIWGACPILLFWVSRSWMLAHRGLVHDDPMIFAVKDRVSLVCGVLFLAVFAMAR
jgi:4-hydroxybenzoate polyprenyltransferase